MSRKDLIFELDRQLLDNKEINITKQQAIEIIHILKSYDELYNKIEGKNKFRFNLLKEIQNKLDSITETKLNHLILADNSEYHKQRFIVEKEKCDLLEELIKFMYNDK